jgi:hypothetical protein
MVRIPSSGIACLAFRQRFNEGMKLLHRIIGEHLEVRVLTEPNLEMILADPTRVEQALMIKVFKFTSRGCRT